MSSEDGNRTDSNDRNTLPAVRADEIPRLTLAHRNADRRIVSLARHRKELMEREAKLRRAVAEQSKQYERLRQLTAMQMRAEQLHGGIGKLVIISASVVLIDCLLLVAALLASPPFAVLILGLAIVAGLATAVTAQLFWIAHLRHRESGDFSRGVDQLFARANGR